MTFFISTAKAITRVTKKELFNENSFVGGKSKWEYTAPEFDDFELDGKFPPKTRNLWNFSHALPKSQ